VGRGQGTSSRRKTSGWLRSNGSQPFFSERIKRIVELFPLLSVDAFLVSHHPNIRYLSGFSGSAGLLLIEAAEATLFTDSRYTFQAREETTGVRIHIAKGGLVAAVSGSLAQRRGVKRVACSESHLTVAQRRVLESLAGKQVRWVGDDNAVEKLRAVKDSEEIAVIREAAELIGDVFTETVPKIRVGMSELDLAAEIEYGIKRRGSSGPSFETIVASGARSAWAHARPTSKPLRRNELVVLDQGAILRGYCSDMTRTVFLGKASSRVRGLYRAVLDAQQAGKAAIRPGARAGDVDQATRTALRRSGLAKYFTHSTGHGLGLEVHEMPRLGKGDETVLQEGMILTVEPGVYVEGLGGIRIEDDVVVTASGAEDLTTAARDLLEL
jgi:Xaa-Pro aminopeptidase